MTSINEASISHQCLFIDPDTGYECPRDAGDYPFCKSHSYKIRTENRCHNCCKVKPVPKPGQFPHKLCNECFRAEREAKRQEQIASGVCINYPRCTEKVTELDIYNGSRGRCEWCYVDYMRNVHHEIIHYDPLPVDKKRVDTNPIPTKQIKPVAEDVSTMPPQPPCESKRSRKSKKPTTPGIAVTKWSSIPDAVRQAPPQVIPEPVKKNLAEEIADMKIENVKPIPEPIPEIPHVVEEVKEQPKRKFHSPKQVTYTEVVEHASIPIDKKL